MSIRASFSKKVFHFNFKARTSRGLMKDKTSWFIELQSTDRPGVSGLGECAPLPGLSVDHTPDFENGLREFVEEINSSSFTVDDMEWIGQLVPKDYPSVQFGLETALLDLRHGGRRMIFDNSFVKGEPISINGLIWMGDIDFMMDQINKKVAQGFRCLKLKVGGLDFDRECDILDYVRKRYFRDDITLRLDANGAFKPDDVLYKLGELARFRVHSIEQPIRPGLPEMEELCRKSPIPVAFDEELIGVSGPADKRALLQRLKPQFIVLKPTLHGGFKGCDEWIAIAGSLNTGWWMTSALESGIGLNAICQFTANYHPTIPQGLGTGAIYSDNIASPLTVKEGKIFYDTNGGWQPF